MYTWGYLLVSLFQLVAIVTATSVSLIVINNTLYTIIRKWWDPNGKS